MPDKMRAFSRVIMERKPEPDGVGEELLLDCGHRVVVIACTGDKFASCSQCVNRLLEAVRDA